MKKSVLGSVISTDRHGKEWKTDQRTMEKILWNSPRATVLFGAVRSSSLWSINQQRARKEDGLTWGIPARKSFALLPVVLGIKADTNIAQTFISCPTEEPPKFDLHRRLTSSI
ncbi:hypothetical protein FRC14_005884 [Serendipita sp. 396]|nr:hypothetical protein FRC14_005884 [Serendipita sp. 396]KAG8777349.1 hypothetical protein FRC15_011390 [Serendipita sp. 397]KAG8794193.1 hypothetical protein FRC16_010666 [Serendipita sp. 398]KAG8823814.1 hypothetical protein FRC19_003080 [Serendipita sp. 401]KAG8862500.1 hypothetical protein FRC20_011218 [Serendipita sp. 405]KAG9054757.1 hypothetical protein FS842_004223 [Serendipita sp. 407]